MLRSLVAGLLAVVGCSKSPESLGPSKGTFLFVVDDVFYIKPPHDKVILTGSIRDGSVSVGDSLTVECRNGEVAVTVQAIETLDRGPVPHARAGDQVGLDLRGIRRDQASRDDRVVRKAR